MGNDSPKGQFSEDEWQPVEAVGARTTLRHRLTQALIDTYECDELQDSSAARQTSQLYDWRKQISHSLSIPKLLHYEIRTSLLSASQRQKIFTEHLVRFSQLPFLSKPQAFLLLQQVLTVLPVLFREVGLFHTSLFTICISEDGQARVWMNENLAKNYCEPEDSIDSRSANLELMVVNNLVRLISGKVYNNELPPEYPFATDFQQTCRYLQQVRQQNRLYQVDKIYLDRNVFNDQYRQLLHAQDPNFPPKQVMPHSIPQQLPNNFYQQQAESSQQVQHQPIPQQFHLHPNQQVQTFHRQPGVFYQVNNAFNPPVVVRRTSNEKRSEEERERKSMEEERRKSNEYNQRIDGQLKNKLDLRQEFSPTKDQRRPIEQYFSARSHEVSGPPSFLRKAPIYAQPLPPLPPRPQLPFSQPPLRPQTSSPERRRPPSKPRDEPPTLFVNKNKCQMFQMVRPTSFELSKISEQSSRRESLQPPAAVGKFSSITSHSDGGFNIELVESVVLLKPHP